MPLFPISFSIDSTKIINEIPKKTKLLAHIIPGKLETYIYDNEKDYYLDYQTSMFAITTKKAGWDCLRHYEILANGCIPYFPELENCPEYTLYFFPKKIILETNKFYEYIKNVENVLDNVDIMNIYNKYNTELLNYTKNILNNSWITKYILNVTNNSNAKKILFLSGTSEYGIAPNYLRCLTLIGFKNEFKTECHDYPKIPHIYTSCSNATELYGRGISYTKIINDENRNNNLDTTILKDIENHYYDLIIYGEIHRGMPYFDIVQKYYDQNNIIFLCGEDIHQCPFNILLEHNCNVFMREI